MSSSICGLLSLLLISGTIFDTSESSALLSEHLPQVLHDCIRSLPRSKMAPMIILTRKNKRSHGLVPQLRKLHQFLREFRCTQLDVRDILCSLRTVTIRVMLGLVVGTKRGSGTGGAKPVDRDPGQYLVIFPRVIICPADRSQAMSSS